MNKELPSNSNITWYQNPAWIVFLMTALFLLGIGIYNQIPQKQMVSLFENYELTTGEKNKILTAIGESDLTGYKISNRQILVLESRRAKFLAHLKATNALPTIFSERKEQLASMFLPKSERVHLEQHRKKLEIRDNLLQLPFVSEAWFDMDSDNHRSHFEQTQYSAVAIVRNSKPLPLSVAQIRTIQRTVAGGIASLNPEGVVVIDNVAGISYQSQSDEEIAASIKQVNFRRRKRLIVEEALSHLKTEFEGIAINVELTPLDPTYERRGNENKTASIPVKLASVPKEKHTRIGLNSSGVVTIANTELPTARVIRTRFDAAVVEKSDFSNSADLMNVKIRVPLSLIRNLHKLNPDMPVNECVDRLSSDIESRARKLLVRHQVPTQAEIQVLFDETWKQLSQDSAHRIEELTKRYWPVAALGLISLGAIFVSRQRTVHSNRRDESHIDSRDDLHTKLTDFIDRDPDSAARVIRKWINESE